MGEELEAVIFKTFDIPPMPPVAAQVIQAADDSSKSAGDLAELISADPGMVAKILRVANSALFARASEIESLQQAVVALGFKTVRNLAIAASARTIGRRPGEIEDNLWRHSVGAAVVASCIAMNCRKMSVDEAFTIGILHDVGKFILHQHDPKRFGKVLELRRKRQMTSVAAEFEVFGFDHTAIGAAILRRWGLPDALAGAVRFHQNVSVLKQARAEILQPAACANLANRVAYTLKFGVDFPYVDSGDTQEAAVNILEMTPEGMLKVVQAARDLFEKELTAFQ